MQSSTPEDAQSTGHERTFGDRVAALFASGLYVGYMPVASGTWGSLWVPVLYYLVPANFFGSFLVAATIVTVALGIPAAGRCERFWGGDPSKVIIDEVAGMLVTILFLPLSARVVWAGFFLFRLFDITKPPPARQAERLPGGWGIMVDDLMAGVYANLTLRLLILLVPGIMGLT